MEYSERAEAIGMIGSMATYLNKQDSEKADFTRDLYKLVTFADLERPCNDELLVRGRGYLS